MIQKNEKLKGITINGKEFRLSQYADDTQVFLNGTEESLRETLSVLDMFYHMSGLKINIEKKRELYGSELTVTPQFIYAETIGSTGHKTLLKY